jgi:hypothetical protein
MSVKFTNNFTNKALLAAALAATFAFGLAFMLAFALAFPPAAQAHVLQTDGNIGAVLHIDPDDDPIVGQPATFFFEFHDKQNKFQLSGCNCIAKILSNGQAIFSQGLLPASASSTDQLEPLFQYTFQQKGVYTIDVAGTPNTPGDFQNFDLQYNIRVDRTAAAPTSSTQNQTGVTSASHLWHLLIILAALPIAFIINKVLEKRRRKNSPQTKNNAPPPKADEN